jgi:hypothetical protein
MKDSRTGERESKDSKDSRRSKGVSLMVSLNTDPTELELKKIQELFYFLRSDRSGKHSLKIERHEENN